MLMLQNGEVTAKRQKADEKADEVKKELNRKLKKANQKSEKRETDIKGLMKAQLEEEKCFSNMTAVRPRAELRQRPSHDGCGQFQRQGAPGHEITLATRETTGTRSSRSSGHLQEEPPTDVAFR